MGLFKKNKNKKEEFEKYQPPETIEEEIPEQEAEEEISEEKIQEVPEEEEEEPIEDEILAMEERIKKLKEKKEQQRKNQLEGNIEGAELRIVNELPQAPIRNYIDPNTKKPVHLITFDEALMEILTILRNK